MRRLFLVQVCPNPQTSVSPAPPLPRYESYYDQQIQDGTRTWNGSTVNSKLNYKLNGEQQGDYAGFW